MWGQVAQLVEQGTENPRVGSSILSLATIFHSKFLVSKIACTFISAVNRNRTEQFDELTNPAMTKLTPKVQQCVESLCCDGCQAVYRHINQLENGGSVPQTELLSYEEQQQVLAELKSIMAVYGSNCRI
jgi:hypothetical protein